VFINARGSLALTGDDGQIRISAGANTTNATSLIKFESGSNVEFVLSPSRFSVKPIRHPGSSIPSGFYPMFYNPATGEIVVVY
jgi:hypothetical protein